MQPLPFSISHKIGQSFIYAFLKCIKEREVKGYQVENELPKVLVYLFTLMFIGGTPQFVVGDYLHGWLLGVSKGAMVEKLETICKSPYTFLTHVEGAINEL
jgi:hypothetical protein